MASSSFRWIYNVFRWIYNVFASFTGESFGKLFRSHLVKELDRKMMDTSKDDEMEIASSSSGSRRYDVFPSFRGEDVRGSFLSHLLKELRRKSITFIDDEIERSRLIAPELLSAIRGSRIAIVVFSKNYASSTWCLNELVEIHKCFTNLNQMVIPIFFHVDPSEVKKQTGDFGKVFENTCKGKSEDEKQSWKQALADVATMAGEDLRNWPNEASMIEKVAQDVLKKTMTSSDEFGDFVGIEDHLEALNSMLCWESEDAIMVGISGTSGIGKTTIARALYSQLSSQFHLRAFETCRRTIGDDYCQKLFWEEQLLSKMLDEKNLKIEIVGAVKERLKEKKVLIVLDDVDDLELLNTLVGQAGWFGYGSRIIVITQDRRLLEAHEIELIHEVEFPSELLALKIFCRSAFAQDSPPDGFVELAVEVAKLAGNLPLGLSVLGSSLRRRGKAEWRKMLPMLRNGLDGKIEKTLRVSYDRLDRKERDLFLYIACLFNGDQVRHIIDLLRDSVDIRLTMLAEKSLIRITTQPETVVMHNLLQKLGREIVRAESIDNPGRRRFLVDIQDIRDVLIDNDNTGMQTVLGIYLDASYTPESFSINDQSFESVRSLQFLIVSDYRLWLKYRRGKLLIPMHMDSDGLFSFPVDPKWLQLGTGGRLDLPKRLVYLPPKLKLLRWSNCPFNYLPYSFKGAYLVELTMENSNLKKLWKETPQLGMLKRMDMRGSRHLKEIPDLSTAINLEDLILIDCSSLVTLPSSIGNVTRLKHLYMMGCTKLEKLWDGVQSLASLERVDMSGCKNLTEIPDLSKATNLESLRFNNCKSLVTVPSTIGNLQNLLELQMKGCTGLEVLPTYVNLSSLQILDLSGCSSLRTFPLISTSIVFLYLEDTAIEEVPSCIESFSSLVVLMMYRCKRLKDISLKIFGMTRLTFVDFADCRGATLAFRRHHKIDHSDIPLYKNIEYTPRRKLFRHFVGPDFHGTPVNGEYFSFQNCFKLDRYVREGILRSCSRPMALPGGEVPMSFQHRAHGDSLTVTLPQSSLAREFLEVKACVVIDFPPTEGKDSCSCLEVKIGRTYRKSFFENSADLQLCKMDHLFSCSFKLETKNLPSESAVNNVEFKFSCFNRIKECGVMIDSDGSSEKESPDDSDGSSAKESPDDSDGMIRLYNASLEKIDLSGGKNLREIPDLSKATNLVKLTLNNCTSLVTVPSTIGKLQKLIELHMKGCTGLEVLPTDVNLSSLEVLDLSGCSSLRTFPRISRSIKLLYLENTAIEEVPCCIENFGGLTVLMMCCCKRLKIISPNIFRMKSLKFVDFTDCRDATLAFSDATMEDHSDIPLYENIEYTPRRKLFRHNGDHPNHYSLPNEPYFSFQNCFKLGRDVREGILRSCSEPVALPGGEVPTYFQHRAYGDSLTVTLPQGSLSQESLDFKTCVLVDFPPTEGKDSCSYLEVELDFDGVKFRESFFEDAAELQLCKTNHLFSCSFSLVTKNIPSELAFKYLELKFSCFNTIKECGVMIHSDGSSEKESPDGSDGSSEKKSPDDSDGSSEKESPDDSDGMILLYDAESGGVEFVADEVDRINEKVLDWDETEALRKGLETIRGLCN